MIVGCLLQNISDLDSRSIHLYACIQSKSIQLFIFSMTSLALHQWLYILLYSIHCTLYWFMMVVHMQIIYARKHLPSRATVSNFIICIPNLPYELCKWGAVYQIGLLQLGFNHAWTLKYKVKSMYFSSQDAFIETVFLVDCSCQMKGSCLNSDWIMHVVYISDYFCCLSTSKNCWVAAE